MSILALGWLAFSAFPITHASSPNQGAPGEYRVIRLGPEESGRPVRFDDIDELREVEDADLALAEQCLSERPGAALEAQDVNRRGEVVGLWHWEPTIDPEGGEVIAFMATPRGLEQIRVPDQLWSRAYGINDHGDVVGEWGDLGGQAHGFLWRRGRVYDLDRLVSAGEPWLVLRGMDIAEDGCIFAVGQKGDEVDRIVLYPRAYTPTSFHPPLGALRVPRRSGASFTARGGNGGICGCFPHLV